MAFARAMLASADIFSHNGNCSEAQRVAAFGDAGRTCIMGTCMLTQDALAYCECRPEYTGQLCDYRINKAAFQEGILHQPILQSQQAADMRIIQSWFRNGYFLPIPWRRSRRKLNPYFVWRRFAIVDNFMRSGRVRNRRKRDMGGEHYQQTQKYPNYHEIESNAFKVHPTVEIGYHKALPLAAAVVVILLLSIAVFVLSLTICLISRRKNRVVSDCKSGETGQAGLARSMVWMKQQGRNVSRRLTTNSSSVWRFSRSSINDEDETEPLYESARAVPDSYPGATFVQPSATITYSNAHHKPSSTCL